MHPVFCPRGQQHPHSSTATAQNMSRRCQGPPGACSSPVGNRSLGQHHNVFLKINFIVSSNKIPIVTKRDDLQDHFPSETSNYGRLPNNVFFKECRVTLPLELHV